MHPDRGRVEHSHLIGRPRRREQQVGRDQLAIGLTAAQQTLVGEHAVRQVAIDDRLEERRQPPFANQVNDPLIANPAEEIVERLRLHQVGRRRHDLLADDPALRPLQILRGQLDGERVRKLLELGRIEIDRQHVLIRLAGRQIATLELHCDDPLHLRRRGRHIKHRSLCHDSFLLPGELNAKLHPMLERMEITAIAVPTIGRVTADSCNSPVAQAGRSVQLVLLTLRREDASESRAIGAEMAWASSPSNNGDSIDTTERQAAYRQQRVASSRRSVMSKLRR